MVKDKKTNKLNGMGRQYEKIFGKRCLNKLLREMGFISYSKLVISKKFKNKVHIIADY